MTYEEFRELVGRAKRPVILLEGTRALPTKHKEHLVNLAEQFARDCPESVFRTGNAKGSDEAFAEGISKVASSRLQIVLPYAGHRKQAIPEACYNVAISQLPGVAEERAVYETSRASPKYTSMLKNRHAHPRLKSKSRYLLRDTIKVVGAADTDLTPATVGVFYANSDDPMKGGTGHTIRVCHDHGVPVILQNDWMQWRRT